MFSGPIYFYSWNKTFKFSNNLLFYLIFDAILWILLHSDSFISTFKLLLIYILTTCLHSSCNSFSFSSHPLNLGDSQRLYCSRSCIFLDFNSFCDLNYSSFPSDMRVQLKKNRRKVCIANFISAKRLPNAAGGLGGAVSPPVGPGLSLSGGQGDKAPGKFHVFSSKNALDWLILRQFLTLIL